MSIIYGLNGAHLLLFALIGALWVGYLIYKSPTYADLIADEEREAQERRARFYAVDSSPPQSTTTTCTPRSGHHWSA